MNRNIFLIEFSCNLILYSLKYFPGFFYDELNPHFSSLSPSLSLLDLSQVTGVLAVWHAVKEFEWENTSARFFSNSPKLSQPLTIVNAMEEWSQLTTLNDVSWNHVLTLTADTRIEIVWITTKSKFSQQLQANPTFGVTKATQAAVRHV